MHLIKADLRRAAPLLAAWVVVVTATTVIEGVQPTLPSIRAQQTLSIISSLVWLARILLVVLIVPVVVQLHPLVGSDAFWLTRPIPRVTLLMAKVALLWPFVALVPTLAQAVLMIAYGITPGTIALVSASTALNHTILFVLLLVASAFTASLARYAVLWGSLFAAMAAFLAIELAIGMSAGETGITVRPRLEELDGTIGLLFTVLALCAGFGLLVVQYRRRSRRWAVLAGVCGLTVAYVVATSWRVPLFARSHPLPAWTSTNGVAQVSADWSTVRLIPNDPFYQQMSKWRTVTAEVRVDGFQPHWSGVARLRDATLRVHDGRLFGRTDGRADDGSSFLASGSFAGAVPESARAALLDLLDVDNLIDRSAGAAGGVTEILRVDAAQFPSSGSAVGRYQGRFNVLLTNHEIAGVLRLEPGAVHRHADYRVSIEGVQGAAESMAVMINEAQAASRYRHELPFEYTFFLKNRDRREAIVGFAEPLDHELLFTRLLPFGVGFGNGPSTVQDGFHVGGKLLRFMLFGGRDAPIAPILDERWLAGAEVVIVKSTSAGSIERGLESDNVALPLRSTVGSR
jgi:hypothetical protein